MLKDLDWPDQTSVLQLGSHEPKFQTDGLNLGPNTKFQTDGLNLGPNNITSK